MRTNDMAAFWTRVDKTEDGCWLWTSTLDSNGYGVFSMANVKQRAHRMSYELVHGPIAEGMQLDHLCRVRHCLNPEHLEAVTQAENVRRGLNGYALRELCRAGLHDISKAENVYEGAHGRQCDPCRQVSRERYRERQVAS